MKFSLSPPPIGGKKERKLMLFFLKKERNQDDFCISGLIIVFPEAAVTKMTHGVEWNVLALSPGAVLWEKPSISSWVGAARTFKTV